jgi:phage baseplate assembly protein W
MDNSSSGGREFLGAGVAFPLRLDATGRVAINSLEDHVRQSILLILQTAKGERVMRPDFGAGLQPLVFSPVNAATAALVQHEVRDALIRFEPRIDILSVDVTSDPKEQNLLLVNLQYRVRKTDTMFNLVYPFFLAKGTF